MLTMTAILGKRKRNHTTDESALTNDVQDSANNYKQLQTLFQHHFEAEFEPLKTERLRPTRFRTSGAEDAALSDEDDSSWDGISDEREQKRILVVEYNTLSNATNIEAPREELKQFMVG